jgi:hypothetical protein
MRFRSFILIGCCAAVFGAAVPEVWNTKDFSAWTEKDAQLIMTSSPWVKERPMPVSGRPNVTVIDPNVAASTAPTAALGNPSNASGGPNMSTSGAVGSTTVSPGRNDQTATPQTNSLHGPSAGAPAVQPALKIIWASALPIRLAVLRSRSGSSTPDPDQVARAKQDWKNYVIAVVNLPVPENGIDPKSLAPSASLSAHGKPAEIASESSYRKVGNDDVYFFSFPKASLPLAASDGEVEFKLNTKQANLRQKFQLSSMSFGGQLAL